MCLQNDDTTEYKSVNKNYAQARSQNIETVRRQKFHGKNAWNGSSKATVSPDWTGSNHSNQKCTPMPRARCIKINEHQSSMSFTKQRRTTCFWQTDSRQPYAKITGRSKSLLFDWEFEFLTKWRLLSLTVVLEIIKIDLANLDSVCSQDGFHVLSSYFHFVRSEVWAGGSFCSDRVFQGLFVSTKWRWGLHYGNLHPHAHAVRCQGWTSMPFRSLKEVQGVQDPCITQDFPSS